MLTALATIAAIECSFVLSIWSVGGCGGRSTEYIRMI
jgi:hypothetical protein